MIATDRLILSPLGFKHFGAFSILAMDKNIKYMVFYPMKNTDRVRSFLLQSSDNWSRKNNNGVIPSELSFSVIVKAEDNGKYSFRDCIGVVTLYFGKYERSSSIELGWLLHPLYRKNGYAKESVTAVMEWAEKEYSPKYFFACCDQRNEESRRLCERLNMKFNESRFAHGREEYEYRTIAKSI